MFYQTIRQIIYSVESDWMSYLSPFHFAPHMSVWIGDNSTASSSLSHPLHSLSTLPLTLLKVKKTRTREKERKGTEKRRKRKIKEGQASSSPEGVEYHPPWSPSLGELKKSPFLFTPIINPNPYLDFIMHEWKKKMINNSLISSVSSIPITQSSHKLIAFLSNGSYVIFVRKSWFLLKTIPITWKQEGARLENDVGGQRVTQLLKESYHDSRLWIVLLFISSLVQRWKTNLRLGLRDQDGWKTNHGG